MLPFYLMTEPQELNKVSEARSAVDLVWKRYFHYAKQIALHRHSRFLASWVGYEVGLRNELAAARAWAKKAKAGKALSFTYIILVGMPLSQTIYGFILMLVGLSPLTTGTSPAIAKHAGTLLGVGIGGGLAELFSAWIQGLIGAAACRAISEGEGKGLVFMIIAMGIVETVGLFGFVFLLLVLP
jgi:V/A-type H+-transporting ATPase subunit K